MEFYSQHDYAIGFYSIRTHHVQYIFKCTRVITREARHGYYKLRALIDSVVDLMIVIEQSVNI